MSSVEDATFNVAMDGKYFNEVKTQEKKAGADALAVVKKVLINACMDEGSWIVKDPKRITKKGPQKFKVIRIESRGGLKFIRFWCKPRGNDTSYEYSLVPPNGVDVEKLFLLLKRTDSISLEIPESLDLPVALFERIVDIKPVFKPVPKIKVYEHKEEEIKKVKEEESSNDEALVEAQSDRVSEEPSYVRPEISNQVNRQINQNEIEKISSLLILDPIMLYEHEAMDKALIAFAMSCENGYAKRIPLSSCLKENLGIEKYVKEYCEGLYASIESAMKSLITALVNNKYIDRSRWNTTQKNESGGIKGYSLTEKGEKRIKALLARCDDNICSKINKNWSLENIDQADNPIEHQDSESEINLDGIEKLKLIISAHDKATAEISETNGLIENLISEKKELTITQTGFKLAEENKIKQIQEIEEELKIIRSKIKTIDENIEKKQSEIDGWERYKLPFESDLAKAEEEISRLTGRRKI